MGQPKAWLPFGGETMLQRIVRILGEVVSPIVVVAAPGQELPELPSATEVVRDLVEGLGPLQGLAAGLASLSGRVNAAYVCGCDAPFLKPAFVRRMTELLRGFSAAIPFVHGVQHALAGVYRIDILPKVEMLLESNRRRMADLFESLATRFVAEDELIVVDPSLQSLRNLNTPEDYAAALCELSCNTFV